MTELSRVSTLIEAGRCMREIVSDFEASTPVGYRVTGHVGRGGLTATPWIGVFHPDITVRPQEGLYVALIRHADSAAATLTVQQGGDQLRLRLGAAEARTQLRRRADRIRAAISLKDEPLDMNHFGTGTRQRGYAAGSIAAKTYRLQEEPGDAELSRDLRSMLRILDSAASVLDDATGAAWINSDPRADDNRPMPASMRRFVPKSSDDYTVELAPRTLVKTRLHEAVVNDLERHAHALSWAVTSEHPIDLVLRKPTGTGEAQCIVEVKTVKGGRAVDAVRAAIGQLLTYRFQLFEAEIRATILLVAAFSEDIGPSLRQLLSDELDIAVLWLDDRQWRGCELAERRKLVRPRSI
ncbi:MrcB family domain-containing protein [Pseudonocardia acaciae]|uniref:MrcB family domain-containing protein n=1 Tax=Pseudonocardia acaciae TaxID=551276 RepID=UPI00055D89A6